MSHLWFCWLLFRYTYCVTLPLFHGSSVMSTLRYQTHTVVQKQTDDDKKACATRRLCQFLRLYTLPHVEQQRRLSKYFASNCNQAQATISPDDLHIVLCSIFLCSRGERKVHKVVLCRRNSFLAHVLS